MFAGAYRSAEEALVEIPKIRPHVVLMDIRLPGMDGGECARRLRIIVPRLKIVFVTGLLDLDTINKTLQTGADGYLTKPVSAAECLAALQLAEPSRLQLRKEASTLPFRDHPRPGKVRANNSLLTAREKEILGLLEEGLLDKEIADKLGISYSTVHFHLHNIFPKFGAGNRMEAVRRWRDANRS